MAAGRKKYYRVIQSQGCGFNQPTLIALLLELVPLEEDLAIQLLVPDHLLLLHERKEGCHIHGRRSVDK